MNGPEVEDTAANSAISGCHPGTETVSELPARPGCGCGRSVRANEDNGAAYVYALGKIEPRFASLALEREFFFATGRSDTAGLTDLQAIHAVLSQRQNRYLARGLCWTLSVEGVPSYILRPRDPLDMDLLIKSIEPETAGTSVVIGLKGPDSSPEMCGGLRVPMVAFDQIFSIDREKFIGSMARPESISDLQKERLGAAAEELFDRIRQIADNAGAKDEHRALNFLAVRYPAIYAQAAEEFWRNFSLTGVEAGLSRLSGERKIISVVFTYTNRETDVTEKFFVRVDASEEFPFLVTKMAPYYDR